MTRPDRPDPLQPVERELAEALARTASAGPSAKLDATILAAARAAAASDGGTADGRAGEGSGPADGVPPPTGATRGHHRRRRSPAWLRGGALAATVVLAVGVAWQLRPQFEAAGVGDMAVREEATDVAPVPASPPAAAADDSAKARPAMAPELRGIAPESAPPSSQSAAERSSREAAAREAASGDTALSERRARQSSAAPAARAMPVEAAPASAPTSSPAPAIAPTAAPVPPPPAPPAPPAPPPATPEPPRFLQAQPPRESRATIPGTAVHKRVQGAHAEPPPEAEDTIWFDQPVDLVPPASVDSPAVREAWLARIHELVAAERYQEARDSFAEFRRRHPDAVVPDDLDMLLGDE